MTRDLGNTAPRSVPPRLKGTPKQVGRASPIREHILSRAAAYVSSMDDHHQDRELVDRLKGALGQLRRRTAAAYWIERRHWEIEYLLLAEAYLTPRPPTRGQ
jgi:hypothetical protein